MLSNTALLRLCTAATAASLLPGSYLLARRPSATNLLYASVCSGLSFFLWSFQVHEKSILLPLLPATLLLGREPLAATWFTTVAAFSMFPLLEKDGLTIAYWATQLGFNLLIAPHWSLAKTGGTATGGGAYWWGRLGTQAHYLSVRTPCTPSTLSAAPPCFRALLLLRLAKRALY